METSIRKAGKGEKILMTSFRKIEIIKNKFSRRADFFQVKKQVDMNDDNLKTRKNKDNCDTKMF